jgi:hypothetical protein
MNAPSSGQTASRAAVGVSQPSVLTRNTQQEIALASNSVPHIGADRLYCDTLKTTLVLNYSGLGSRPLAITRIALNTAPVGSTGYDGCKVDPLASQPKGITLRDSYVFTIRDAGIVGKYIASGNVGAAFDVVQDNILETTAGTQVISMKVSDDAVVRDVYITSVAARPTKVWFTIYFNAGGEKSVGTRPIYIESSQ